ncbi:hypothetical protein EPUS_06693 [Endocarpon pusillum Z07020]|uniref:Uncharacterized protein n=1 Tax=Endocarpon pusillum (strain Z07020 / HMAS-L-300199) TaxID=1263415 RepID=U1GBE0_ENDPU|nr:uncharacterized protein EPUS_06693 [Endocarpon pusillum Z07020]ERF69006.1 hypothetical protein EPUS_06693 [Endocarpon pusillum Z07020]
MGKIEVLAYIAAPSGFKDDARYLAQAGATVDFEPCSRLQVYDLEDHWQEVVEDQESSYPVSGETTFNKSFTLSAWHHTDAVCETPAQKATRHLLRQDSRHGRQASLTKTGSAAGQEGMDFTRSFNWKITKQAAMHDPPSKVPSFQETATISTIQTARTPEIPRPKTAPAGTVTSRPRGLRKRTRSESSSFGSLKSVVPDSQENQASIAPEDFASSTVNTSIPRGFAAHLLSKAAVQEQPAKRPKQSVKRLPTDHEGDLSQLSGIPNISQQPRTANTMLSSSPQDRRTFNDLTERAMISSDSATIWPPNPRGNITYAPSPEQKTSPRNQPSAFYTIPPPSSQPESRDDWLFSSAPITGTTSRTQPTEHNHPSQPFSSICSLPPSIHAPPPPVGHASYITHLTPSLRTLATRLPLVTSFRPNLVKRNINDLERGYWFLRIPIVRTPPLQPETESLDPSRAGDSSKDRGRGRGKGKARIRGQPWTASSFLSFWTTLAQFVQSGQAGWGVSVYREDPQPALPKPSTGRAMSELETKEADPREAEETGKTAVVLKVTCWGEILPHIYLLLWVLSDKRTEGVKMEWRDAAEEAVVRMGSDQGRRSCC